jgi:hypothetical protein
MTREFLIVYFLTAPFVFWIYERTRAELQRRKIWEN